MNERVRSLALWVIRRPNDFLTLELGPPVACRELLDDRQENARVIAGTERFAGQRHERLDDVFASTVTAA